MFKIIKADLMVAGQARQKVNGCETVFPNNS